MVDGKVEQMGVELVKGGVLETKAEGIVLRVDKMTVGLGCGRDLSGTKGARVFDTIQSQQRSWL